MFQSSKMTDFIGGTFRFDVNEKHALRRNWLFKMFWVNFGHLFSAIYVQVTHAVAILKQRLTGATGPIQCSVASDKHN